MSGSLFDYTQNDPLMGGSGPAGVPGAGTPPTTLATMWDWLRRQRSPLTGLQPGQQVPNGQGLTMNPDGSVGTPGGGFNGPPRPMDPTTAAPPVPAPQSPMAAAMDPYRNAPSPASVQSAPGWGASTTTDQANAPAPPTPQQAAQSAQRDASGANYNTETPPAQQAQSSQPSQPITATPGDPSAPRGIRNNNPLNLTYVQGQDGVDPNQPSDGRFGRYLSMQHGIGAATNQLLTYGDRGLDTTRKIVNTWAPPGGENPNNDAYVGTVAKAIGVGPDDKLDLSNPATMQKLVGAMGQFENGQSLDPDAVKGGVQIGYDLHKGKPMPSVQVAGPGASTGTNGANMAPDQQSQLAALGIDPKSFQLPFDYQAAVQPSTSEKLYRMAAALQGNAGQAAGLMAGDRQKMLEANNNALATQRLLGTLAYQNAGLGIRQQVANNGTARVGIAADNSQTARDRLALAQQQLNPDVKARLAQASAGGKSASADINTTLSTQAIQADNQASSDIDNSIKLIQQRPDLMGPTLQNRWSRFAAENGLTGEAADLNALQKMTTDQRNQMLTALTNGHVGGIRSNAELQNISKAVADVGTSPAAANFILNMQKQQVQARQAWRDELTARLNDPDQVDSVTGQHLAVTRSQFLNGYNKDHPLPEYESPTAGNAAGTKPGQNADGSTKGAATLRYDQATGRMVPM